jgi:NADH-quinone oxidoreductase subunit J
VSPEVLVFDILGVLAVIAAAGVVLARNPVHSAVALVVTFVNLSGIFVLLRAEFLAVVQIIVYTGAILVLVLFVIMLVDPEDLPEFHAGQPLQRVLALIIGLMLLGEIAAAVLTRSVVGRPGPWTDDAVQRAGGNVQVLGQFLYSGYVLPIQAVAVVLLVGTIGALVLARPDEMGTSRPRVRRSGTLSLGHPRGADYAYDPAALPSGAMTSMAVEASAPAEPVRAEMRGGLVMVKDANIFTEIPAWELDDTKLAPTTGNGHGGRLSGEVIDGMGVGSERDD